MRIVYAAVVSILWTTGAIHAGNCLMKAGGGRGVLQDSDTEIISLEDFRVRLGIQECQLSPFTIRVIEILVSQDSSAIAIKARFLLDDPTWKGLDALLCELAGLLCIDFAIQSKQLELFGWLLTGYVCDFCSGFLGVTDNSLSEYFFQLQNDIFVKMGDDCYVTQDYVRPLFSKVQEELPRLGVRLVSGIDTHGNIANRITALLIKSQD